MIGAPGVLHPESWSALRFSTGIQSFQPYRMKFRSEAVPGLLISQQSFRLLSLNRIARETDIPLDNGASSIFGHRLSVSRPSRDAWQACERIYSGPKPTHYSRPVSDPLRQRMCQLPGPFRDLLREFGSVAESEHRITQKLSSRLRNVEAATIAMDTRNQQLPGCWPCRRVPSEMWPRPIFFGFGIGRLCLLRTVTYSLDIESHCSGRCASRRAVRLSGPRNPRRTFSSPRLHSSTIIPRSGGFSVANSPALNISSDPTMPSPIRRLAASTPEQKH